MADNDNGVPLRFHFAQNLEQFFDFLHGQYRGRLVQNNGFCPVVQYLYNFQSLFFADRHIFYKFSCIYLKAEFFGGFFDFGKTRFA